MKHIKLFNESLYEEEVEKAKHFPLIAGDYLVCVFSDYEEFDYGKLYEIKEISGTKLTIAVYGNSGKRYFFQNDVENELVSKTFREFKDNAYDKIIGNVLLYPGTLEEYLDKKEAEKYNL